MRSARVHALCETSSDSVLGGPSSGDLKLGTTRGAGWVGRSRPDAPHQQTDADHSCSKALEMPRGPPGIVDIPGVSFALSPSASPIAGGGSEGAGFDKWSQEAGGAASVLLTASFLTAVNGTFTCSIFVALSNMKPRSL